MCVWGGYPYALPPIISIIIVTIITIIIITIIIKIFCELFTGVCVGPISTFSSHVLVCMFLIVYQHLSVFVFWQIVFAFAFLGFHLPVEVYIINFGLQYLCIFFKSDSIMMTLHPPIKSVHISCFSIQNLPHDRKIFQKAL